MSQYKVGIGYDLASDDLALVTPGCTSKGVRYARRSFSASGDQVLEGAYVELEFSTLQSESMYQALLAQFGVLSSATSPVTIWVRGDVLGYTLYNGIAVRPSLGDEADWSNYFLRNVTILVRNLVQLIEGA